MKKTLVDVGLMTGKELLQLWRDKASLIFTFLIPIFVLLAFGATVSVDPRMPVPVLVVDLDDTRSSREFGQAIERSDEEFNYIGRAATESEARDMMMEGQAVSAVVIPVGFEELLALEQRAEVVIIYDDTKNFVREFTEIAASEILTDYLGAAEAAVSIERSSLSGRDLSPRKAVGVLVLGVALIYSSFDDVAGAMARERERGTLSRLFLTPISRWSIFLGKTIASLFLTLARTSALLLLLVYYLGVSIQGNLALVYLIALLIASITIALGFVVSARGLSGRSVAILSFALMVPLIFFTGVIRPVELVPEGTRGLMRVIPYTYTNDALRRVINLGQSLSDVWADLAVAFGFFLLFLIVAGALLRRTML